MTTAALFDLDETIVQYDRSFEAVVADACRAVGVAPPEDLPRRYVDLFFEHLGALAADPYRAAATDLVSEFDLGVDPESFAARYVDEEVRATYVPEAVYRTLDGLADERPVGVLTNGVGPVQRRKLAAHDLGGYFDDVLAATDVGLLKPDPEIFHRARERLPAEQYVYVGDSITHDVRPAKDLGFGTVLVGDGKGVERGDPDPVDLHVADPAEFERIRTVLE
jgi:HAD superfamily hydrolase (TIGR01509 family)